MKLLLTTLCLLASGWVLAQTAGHPILTSIEAKTVKIEENDKKVGEMNRRHLNSYAAEAKTLDSLKTALSQLLAERDQVMREYRSGRFCNGCGRTASELRKSGVYDPEDHFRQNGGTHPPTQAQIDAKEAEYQRKIDALQRTLKDFEEGENVYSKLRDALDRQMNDLKASSDNLREEIQELSKKYKEAVVREGKNLQQLLISELMRILANKHYTEDRIDIIAVKLNDLVKEESDAVAKSNEKVKKETEDEKTTMQSEINLNKDRINQLQTGFMNMMSTQSSLESQLVQELNQLKQAWKAVPSSNKTEIEKIEAAIKSTEDKLQNVRKQTADIKTDYEQKKSEWEIRNKELSDKIWNLTITLSQKQQAAADQVKKGFDVKRRILNDAKAARTMNLQQTGSLLISKQDAARRKFMEFAAEVDRERIRLLTACSNSGASCYGTDTHGTVVGNWNTAEGCIGEMESSHGSNDPVYGCVEEAATYKQEYSSFMSGMSDSDLEALRRKSGRTKFDLILKKIN
jgi:chromosome segregation ATPase